MAPRKILLIAGALFAGALFLYGPGFIRWVELRSGEGALKSEIGGLKLENQRLIEEARRLREDPSYAEAIYRNELGFVRPGETVVRLKEEKPAARKSSSTKNSSR
ncbi:MAG: septum formation initiator family protein [Elusimicrobia bacterium]|nr:septum formation initiator family protein [Elusimicrobiota bacterium]